MNHFTKKIPIKLLRNVSVVMEQGKREYMEDTYTVAQYGPIHVYGVFDGHSGDEVAKLLKKYLPSYIFMYVLSTVTKNVAELKQIHSNMLRMRLRKAFLLFDWDLYQNKMYFKGRRSFSSGSTAVVLVKIYNRLFFCNVGDSRLLMFRDDGSIIYHTQDHKPNIRKELTRIQLAGGFIKKE